MNDQLNHIILVQDESVFGLRKVALCCIIVRNDIKQGREVGGLVLDAVDGPLMGG